jgi:diacylglycerol kinase family enzyme
MSLLKKLSMKKHFKSGTHLSFPVTEIYSAQKLEINYSEKILIQLDGEGRLLTASDFPLVMELSKPFITVIKPN